MVRVASPFFNFCCSLSPLPSGCFETKPGCFCSGYSRLQIEQIASQHINTLHGMTRDHALTVLQN